MSDLLTNEGYFARYRFHLSAMNCRQAWEQVESELPFGLRRFGSYAAFKNALKMERKGALPEYTRLHFDEKAMK